MSLTVAIALLGGCAGLLALARLLRGAWRVNRRIVRIAELVTELSPNSGHSIKDTVNRVERKLDLNDKKTANTEKKVGRVESKVDALTTRFDEHLRNHHQGGN